MSFALVGKANKGGGVFYYYHYYCPKTCFNKKQRKTVKDKKGGLEKLLSKGHVNPVFPTLQLVDF